MCSSDLNILQNFDCTKTFCVTLNGEGSIDPNTIIKSYRYSHPLYTRDAMSALAADNIINVLQGTAPKTPVNRDAVAARGLA